jgi:uncharacterized membrane protein YdjX (TVP38/TMEM64 family)
MQLEMSEFRKSIQRWVAPLALLIGLLFVFYRSLPVERWSNEAMVFADRMGAYGAVLFGAIYVIATLALFPCAFLTIAAGMMYGLWGIPLVLTAAVVAAALAFLFARHFFAARAEKLLQQGAYGRALRTAIADEGWIFMVLLRISPLIPFSLNNYLLGAAPVRFLPYISATLIGAVPGTLLYTYLGTFGRSREQSLGPKVLLLVFGLVATGVLARITLRRTRAILARQGPLTVAEDLKG